MIPYILYVLLVIVLLLVSFFSIEAWPFSAYPMFSNPYNHSFSSALFIEIEQHTGEKFIWKPKRPLLQKQVDSHLKSVLLDENYTIDISCSKAKPELLKKVVAHFYALYLVENSKIKDLSKVNLIHQRVSELGKAERPHPVVSFSIQELNNLNSTC